MTPSITTIAADSLPHSSTTSNVNDNVLEKNEYLPVSQLALAMREGTKSIHHVAENSAFTKRFVKGEINIEEHGRYLISLYFVYKSLEDLLEKHKDHTSIKAIYFPHELGRLEALKKDIAYYYGKSGFDRVTDPGTMTPAIKAYVKAMESAADVDPTLLVAHSYSRYLGDLSGGLILAKRLKKFVLGLGESDDVAEGLDFYAFDNIGNINAFKAEYREQLDTVPVTQTLKELVVAEAIHSFELNIALFDEIQKLSDEGKLFPVQSSQDDDANTASWPSLSVAAVVAGASAFGAAAYARLVQ